MSIISKYVSLKEYINSGDPNLSHFQIKKKHINLNDTKNILVKNEWISVDPYMRARMTEKKNYKPSNWLWTKWASSHRNIWRSCKDHNDIKCN